MAPPRAGRGAAPPPNVGVSPKPKGGAGPGTAGRGWRRSYSAWIWGQKQRRPPGQGWCGSRTPKRRLQNGWH